MEKIRIGSLYPIRSQKPLCIVEVNLNNSSGYVKFTNGTQLEFQASTLALLRHYKGEHEMEMRSNNASESFLKQLEDGLNVWDNMLMDTCKINFYGIWSCKLLAFLISKAPKLEAVTFTYWQCDDPAKALDAINSKGISELSMHVAHGRHMSVVEALERLGHRASLEQLVLVFDVELKTYIIPCFQDQLSHVLAPGANVMLLFGGEKMCIKALEDEGYILDGHVRMATNELYKPQSTKVYETYEIYQKDYCNESWRVGCRIGKFSTKHIPPLLPVILPSKQDSEDVLVPLADQALLWEAVNTGFIPDAEFKAVGKNTNYSPYEELVGEEICCKLNEHSAAEPNKGVKKWKIPRGTNTKIQKLIYNGQLTEMLTSNGFYIVLDKMDDEAEFFATMSTTPRFAFICTTSHRRYIVTENLDMFLADACHIEFVGTWYSTLIEQIASYFTASLYALTLMEIELHTTRPIIQIFNAMSDRVKQNLKVIHFDARATADRSVGSVINAILKQKQMKFEELIIISNKWSCWDEEQKRGYKCRLLKHVEDCVNRLLVQNGSATTVVMENKIFDDYFDAGFISHPFHVVAPLAYPNRGIVNGLTRLMDGYSQNRENHIISIVVPGRSLL